MCTHDPCFEPKKKKKKKREKISTFFSSDNYHFYSREIIIKLISSLLWCIVKTMPLGAVDRLNALLPEAIKAEGNSELSCPRYRGE